MSARWESWLDVSNAATREVRQLLTGCPPSGVLGRALLVEGVSMVVRGHKLRDRGRLHRKVLADAAAAFVEAEQVLVDALGPVNESSMYVTNSSDRERVRVEGLPEPLLWRGRKVC